ncbi:hypothetical protein NCCP2716_01130 [Sporosarcina sp. NCCP-2716]|nr:hypothetical protein NCCP2716_01130 [Sporosarcina sp. NCCP-2716]
MCIHFNKRGRSEVNTHKPSIKISDIISFKIDLSHEKKTKNTNTIVIKTK